MDNAYGYTFDHPAWTTPDYGFEEDADQWARGEGELEWIDPAIPHPSTVWTTSTHYTSESTTGVDILTRTYWRLKVDVKTGEEVISGEYLYPMTPYTILEDVKSGERVFVAPPRSVRTEGWIFTSDD